MWLINNPETRIIVLCLVILVSVWIFRRWWESRKHWFTGYVSHIESEEASVVVYDWKGRESHGLLATSKLKPFGITTEGQGFKMWAGEKEREYVCLFYPTKRKAISRRRAKKMLERARRAVPENLPLDDN